MGVSAQPLREVVASNERHGLAALNGAVPLLAAHVAVQLLDAGWMAARAQRLRRDRDLRTHVHPDKGLVCRPAVARDHVAQCGAHHQVLLACRVGLVPRGPLMGEEDDLVLEGHEGIDRVEEAPAGNGTEDSFLIGLISNSAHF